MKTPTQLANMAHSRANKCRPPCLDDEVLLDDVTRAARDADKAEQALVDCVRAACDADLDRDDVVEAVMAGGYSESHARTVVSAVYCGGGKRLRKAGSGPAIPAEALAIAKYAVDQFGDRASKYLLAAYRASKTKTAHA